MSMQCPCMRTVCHTICIITRIVYYIAKYCKCINTVWVPALALNSTPTRSGLDMHLILSWPHSVGSKPSRSWTRSAWIVLVPCRTLWPNTLEFNCADILFSVHQSSYTFTQIMNRFSPVFLHSSFHFLLWIQLGVCFCKLFWMIARAIHMYSCAWALVTRRSGWGGLIIENADDENHRSIQVHTASKLMLKMLMMTAMMNNQKTIK